MYNRDQIEFGILFTDVLFLLK